MNRIFGEMPPQEFSLRGFALTWIWMAAGASLLRWWEQRSENRQTEAPPRPQWRADTPRWLVMVSTVTSVCFLATLFAGYGSAIDGELRLLWADALVAFAFALAAIVRRLGEPFRTPEDPEAAASQEREQKPPKSAEETLRWYPKWRA
ncbi:hypothetical protein ACTMS0_28810 [Micromonospora sp. H33]|uniref:hypothetical protein n=1 Tax=Micromonospora sp. H33 TaxID=3452215 RepID=UPI003F8A710C